MEIIRHEMIDWEPLVLHLYSSGTSKLSKSRVEAVIDAWLIQRERASGCPCSRHFVDVQTAKNPPSIQVLIEWVCEQCLPLLTEQLGKEIRWIGRIEIGMSPGVPETITSFIEVDAKQVTFEDGTHMEVAPFRILKSSVTIGQFEMFQNATGYETTAEKKKEWGNTFRDHLPQCSRAQRAGLPVKNVSHNDAMAYCAWAKMRLPTEAEWLAASLVDDRIFDEVRDHSFLWDSTGRFAFGHHPKALVHTTSWTSTLVDDQMAVVRIGPKLVRLKNWERSVQSHRFVWPRDTHDVMVGFLVAAP